MHSSPIPQYTKIGIRITAIIMAVLLFLMLKNCAYSLYYGSATSQEEINQAYDLGFQTGRSQRRTDEGKISAYDNKNMLLKKMYQKGFRDGWDQEQHKR